MYQLRSSGLIAASLQEAAALSPDPHRSPITAEMAGDVRLMRASILILIGLMISFHHRARWLHPTSINIKVHCICTPSRGNAHHLLPAAALARALPCPSTSSSC